MRAVWVAKYQPPPRTSVVGASATGAPSPSRTVRSAQRRGELGVVGGDEHGGARRGELAQPVRERLLVAAVHAARRLVEQDGGGRLALQHDRQREPLALAAGEVARVAVGERAEAGRLERRGRKLLPHALGDQVVAGVLEQQRRPARRARSARASARRARPRAAAASTCPPRCAPSARRARPAPAPASTPRSTAGPRGISYQTRSKASAGTRRRSAAAARPRRRAAGGAGRRLRPASASAAGRARAAPRGRP